MLCRFAALLKYVPQAPYLFTIHYYLFPKKSPAFNKIAHPHLNELNIRFLRSKLKNGNLAAHEKIRLMLLGSPPDMVHGISLRKTNLSTPLTQVRRCAVSPGCGNSSLL